MSNINDDAVTNKEALLREAVLAFEVKREELRSAIFFDAAQSGRNIPRDQICFDDLKWVYPYSDDRAVVVGYSSEPDNHDDRDIYSAVIFEVDRKTGAQTHCCFCVDHDRSQNQVFIYGLAAGSIPDEEVQEFRDVLNANTRLGPVRVYLAA